MSIQQLSASNVNSSNRYQTEQAMPERDTNCVKQQHLTEDNTNVPPKKKENLEEISALKDMRISSSQSKSGGEHHQDQYQFTEYQRTQYQQQRYRNTTNPDLGQRSLNSLHSSSSRACYGGPVEPAFTSLNPAFAYGGASMAYPSQHHMYQAPAHPCHNYPTSVC